MESEKLLFLPKGFLFAEKNVRDFFSVDKSDHATEGSPPTFHLACFGGTARETMGPLPSKGGERSSGGSRGETCHRLTWQSAPALL